MWIEQNVIFHGLFCPEGSLIQIVSDDLAKLLSVISVRWTAFSRYSICNLLLTCVPYIYVGIMIQRNERKTTDRRFLFCSYIFLFYLTILSGLISMCPSSKTFSWKHDQSPKIALALLNFSFKSWPSISLIRFEHAIIHCCSS